MLLTVYIQKKIPILQLGKIGVQAIVNTIGISIAAAFTVVNRIDDFAVTPEQNIKEKCIWMKENVNDV